MRSELTSFLGLPPAYRRIALEALCSVLLARAALALVPFRWLTWWFERPVRSPELQGEARARARWEAQAAIRFVRRRLSVRVVCFPGAIAAQAMLRRRGVSTTLYYGAARRPGKDRLSTHVWLQDGQIGIVGHEEAAAYHVLACYSSAHPGSRSRDR